jgi:hypothetical protein
MASEHDMQPWAQQFVQRLLYWGLEGAPLPMSWPGSNSPLRIKSARELALEYQRNLKGQDLDATIAVLIEDQARWNAGTGFLTGLGGFAFLPIQLPAAMTATWIIQTRLVATIAILNGFDLDHEAVRTQILLTLIGDEAGEILKQIGVKFGQHLAQAQLRRMPTTALSAINQAVGFRLISRFGSGGIMQLNKAIPLLGGVVGGGVDYIMTRQLGQFAAIELGRRAPDRSREEVIDVEVVD